MKTKLLFMALILTCGVTIYSQPGYVEYRTPNGGRRVYVPHPPDYTPPTPLPTQPEELLKEITILKARVNAQARDIVDLKARITLLENRP